MSAEGKKLNSSRGRRESGGGAQLFAENLQLPLRRSFWRGQIAGGGFGVAQIAGGREAGERGRARERERRAGERKTFLLPPLLATEAIFVARRREEREERGREGGEIFLLLPVKRAYARMQERAREGGRRERETAGERKTFLLPPLLATEAISVARRREEREERGREGGEIFLLLPVKRAYARMQERAREGGRRERGMLDLLHYPIYVTLYKGYGYECNTGYTDYGDYGTPLFKKQLGFITKWQRG